MKLKSLFENSGIEVPLFRGTRLPPSSEVGRVYNFKVRQDRQPANASELASVIFNHGIQRLLGIEDIRKRSIFASSSLENAEQYVTNQADGVVQLILPDTATVVFNPNVRDSLHVFHDFLRDIRQLKTMLWTHGNDGQDFEDLYLTQTADNVWRTVLSSIEPHVHDYLISKFNQIADQMVAGYRKVTPSQIVGGGDVEHIIFGVTDYQGKLIQHGDGS